MTVGGGAVARDGQADPGGAIRRLQQRAADALTRVEGAAPFALVDFPDHPNVGDSAIWLGTTTYYGRAGREPRYVASMDAYSEADLRKSLPAGAIVIHGGGNFGDLWPRHQAFREHLLERFPDRAIIQLPQSIHFDEPARAVDTARAIARHGNFKLFVRDGPSYDFANARFDCETVLCPDMALFIGSLPRTAAEVDVLHLIRTDKERAGGRMVAGAGYSFRVADWLEENRVSLQAAKLRGSLRQLAGGRRDRLGLRAARYDSAAHARLRRGCRLLSSGRVVVTDRLHAHILCLLLGIPHAVLDNRYGKLGRFLDAWTGDIVGVHRASSPDDAEAWAAAMVQAARSSAPAGSALRPGVSSPADNRQV